MTCQQKKVSKFQKEMFLFSFARKMNEIIFLASKMGWIKKIKELYYIIKRPLFFDLTNLRSLRQKYKNILGGKWEQENFFLKFTDL